MPKRKKSYNLRYKYTDRDMRALLSLYTFRCLSIDQLFDLNYSYRKNGSNQSMSYLRQKMVYFKADQLVTYVNATEKTPRLYYLTARGYTIVNQYFSAEFAMESHDIFQHKTSYKALRIETFFVAHQYYLNCFAIDLINMFKDVPGIKYADERHMTLSYVLRPDGILEIPETTVEINGKLRTIPKTQFLLENDMSSERLKTIQEKMQSYREFILSSKRDENTRTIVLYICHKQDFLTNNINTRSEFIEELSKKPELRIQNFRKIACDSLIDIIDGHFDMFINSHQHLLATIKCFYLPQYFGINPKSLWPDLRRVLSEHVNDMDLIKQNDIPSLSSGIRYDAILKCQKTNRLYVFVNAIGEPMSLFKKIMWHKKHTSEYSSANNSGVTFVLLVNKEEVIKSISNVLNLKDTKYSDVFFTTTDRLSGLPFHEALIRPQ